MKESVAEGFRHGLFHQYYKYFFHKWSSFNVRFLGRIKPEDNVSFLSHFQIEGAVARVL